MKRFKAILAAALAGCLLMAFTACSGKTVEEKLNDYVDSNEETLIASAEKELDDLATVSLEVDGNTLVIIYTYQIEIPEESQEDVRSTLDSYLESTKSTYESGADDLSETFGGEVRFRIEYRTMDGETLVSRTFPDDQEG